MKLYVLSREKHEYSAILLCANFKTVLDVLSGLDGTDQHIKVDFVEVADVTSKKNQ